MTLGRRLASATLQLSLANGAVRLLSVATMPILTRLLSPESYGAASIAGTMVALAAVLALAGVDMSYVRAYHDRNSSTEAVQAFVWRYALGAGCIVGALTSLCWWAAVAPVFSVPRYLW